MSRLIEIYKHIKEHDGYVVGKLALGAWRTAKLAYQAEEIGFHVTWKMEEEDWMNFAGDPAEEYREKFQSGEWKCCYAYVKDESGNVLASLGGIILGRDSDPYRECVDYELLAEALTKVLKGRAA